MPYGSACDATKNPIATLQQQLGEECMALKADLLVELRKISDRNLTITQDRWGISVTHPERIMGIYEGNYGYLIEFGMALHLSPDPAVDRETEVKTNAEVIELVLAWFPC